MSATFKWAEDHGAATGSPVRGTTRVQDGSITTASNWKNADDVATAYGSSPITAGQHSYEKFLYGMFTGTWTTIGSGKWSHTATEDAVFQRLGNHGAVQGQRATDRFEHPAGVPFIDD